MCAAGCEGRKLEPAKDLVEVRLSDGTRLSSPFPAGLRIEVVPEVSYFLSLYAQTGEREWSVGGFILGDDVRSGRVVMITIATEPQTGQLRVGNLKTGFASSGSVELSLEKGLIRGTAVAVPAVLSATFNGVIGVSCHVPASRLPGHNSGTDGDGQEAIANDVDFRTADCSPFRNLLK